MTDEAKALVEALKRDALTYDQRWKLVGLVETQAREIERLTTILSELNDADVIARTMAENERLRIALHQIDTEAANTIPPDGKDAAFAALFRIAQIINPFHLPRAVLAGDSHDQ